MATETERALRRKGLSEEQAALVSMKNTKKGKDKSKDSCCSPCGMTEDYPYGLRIELNEESIAKLGIDLPKAGTQMTLTAKVDVDNAGERSEGGKVRRSLSLQITKMALT